jgi:COMPASS component SWD2
VTPNTPSKCKEAKVLTKNARTDSIRYLATHDNSFIRYFEGHEGSVTAIEIHPGADNFISCGRDGTVRLWNVGSKQWQGLLYLNDPYLAAWDPSGTVFAIATPSAGSILLYDHRNYHKVPFAIFDVVEQCSYVDPHSVMQGWSKLAFSNDGKSLLLSTKGNGDFLLDAFDGSLKAYLRKPQGSTRRATAGSGDANGEGSAAAESSGDSCFTPDGRYVMSGAKQNVLVWDTLAVPGENKEMDPTHVLEDKREAAVLAFNPRYNFFATADQNLVFWMPDPHA